MEQPVPPGGETGSPAREPGARLQRSGSNRIIGGVCGGLAEHTGIDPIVFRVTTVVLAFVGGAGVLFYAAAMLLVPDGRTGRAPVDRVAGSRQHRRFRAAALLLAVACGIIVAGGFSGWFGSGSFAIVIIAALALLVAHSRGIDLRAGLSSLFGNSATPTSSAPHAAREPGTPGTTQAAGAPGSVPPPPPPAPPRSATTGQYVDLSTLPPHPGYVGPESASQDAPPRPAGRSITWFVLLAAAVAAVIAVAVQQGLGLPGAVRLPLVAALAVLGLGLVLATWVGRARVTTWGVLLAVALGIVTVGQGLAGHTYLRNVTWRPATAAQLSAQQPYRADVGDARLDLTRLPLAHDPSYDVRARIDAGRLVVTVPRDTSVHVVASCDMCSLDVLGRQAGGADARIDATVPATTTEGEQEHEGGGMVSGRVGRSDSAQTFDLRLRADVGAVVVRRAS